MPEPEKPTTSASSTLAQAVEDLFSYAVDRDDIKWSLARLPDACPADRTAVEYELQALKIVSVGWSINFHLAQSPRKKPLQEAFWQEVHGFARGLSETTGLLIGQDIDYFQTLRDCLDAYLEAMRAMPTDSDPAQAVGPAFARRCRQPGDLFTEAAGARMFKSAVARVGAYLQASGLLEGPSHAGR